MGYTHYVRRKKKLNKVTFKKFAADVRKIYKASAKREIYLAGGLGKVGTSPKANADTVIFNGMDFSEKTSGFDGSHETLNIERVVNPQEWHTPDEKGRYFEFCKTARKPYDLVVVAVLIALKKHFPNAEVSSDGEQDDWENGIKFCQETLGYGDNFSIEIEGGGFVENEVKPVKTKGEVIEILIEQIAKDYSQGDSTVLAELLEKLDIITLIQALPE